MHNLSFPIIRPDERRSVAGWMLSAAGWFSIIGFVLLWTLIMDANAFVVYIVGLGMIFALFYVAAFPRLVNLILRGRKMRAPRALDILSSGDQTPVVLL